MASQPSESLSLRQLQLLHPRERLQVHPLLWTSRHLELLGCPFVDDKHDTTPLPASLPAPSQDTRDTRDIARRGSAAFGGRRPLSDLDSNASISSTNIKQCPAPALPRPLPTEHARWAKVLAGSPMLSVKEAMIHAMFGTKAARASPTSPASTHCVFRFEKNRICLRCLVFSPDLTSAPSPQPTESSAAYLDASSIRDARSKYLKQSCQAWNSVTRSLYNTQLSVLKRAQRAHDSYITAILIAMAQHQCRSGPHKSAHRVHVLLSDVDDKSRMTIYTADIPNSFLDKLAHPRRRPPPCAGFQVHAKIIEYEPFATFQHRLSRALVSCGQKRAREPDSDDDNHEHRAQKRRRADNG